MSKLTWDGIGEKKYEYGVDHGVLYLLGSNTNTYDEAAAWNGLSTITENKGGAEATDTYADNIKYASLRSAETYGCTIEAYTCPDEFFSCDGTAEVTNGMTVGQQARNTFGLSYRTKTGSDAGSDLGDIIHLVYGLTASPSQKTHTTMNESPELSTMSWEATSIPVNVTGYKPTSYVEIDTRQLNENQLKAVEDALYGSTSTEARLPLPDEIKTLIMNAGA